MQPNCLLYKSATATPAEIQFMNFNEPQKRILYNFLERVDYLKSTKSLILTFNTEGLIEDGRDWLDFIADAFEEASKTLIGINLDLYYYEEQKIVRMIILAGSIADCKVHDNKKAMLLTIYPGGFSEVI